MNYVNYTSRSHILVSTSYLKANFDVTISNGKTIADVLNETNIVDDKSLILT